MKKTFVLAALGSCALSSAQLRVCTWNVTNYGGGRAADFKTAIYGIYQGRTLAPDILICTEFLSQSAVNEFLTILNTATNSPGDWVAQPFHDGPDTDSACFYRNTKVQMLAQTVIAFGSTSTSNQPRDTVRYDFRPAGYSAATSTIAAYSVHMKAGSASSDISRRQVEAGRIVNNLSTLPAGWNALVCGDFNMQSSTQTPYVTMVGTTASPGPFYDPIKTPGSWDGNASFKYVHTQDPSSTGTMNSRYDFIITTAGLLSGTGLTYIGNPNIPYSTTAWSDPNHSYRCWGNDGSTFGSALNTTSNGMVGPTIATALMNSANSGGHLPVYMDFKVPPRISSPTVNLNFGKVAQGRPVTLPITVNHAGDLVKWTAAGLSNLNFSFSQTGKFKGPAGTFSLTPGGSGNYLASFDTSVAGQFSGTITITSDDKETPLLTINCTGAVRPTGKTGGFGK